MGQVLVHPDRGPIVPRHDTPPSAGSARTRAGQGREELVLACHEVNNA
jgi:hypothetical protein